MYLNHHFVQRLGGQLNVSLDKFIDFLPNLAIGILVLSVGIFIAYQLNRLFQRRLVGHVFDPLLLSFIGRFIQWTIIVISIALSMKSLGLSGIAGSLVAGAGITAFIIGFAFKDIGENFLSGIILAFKRPFSIGDIIESQTIKGTVEELDLRATHVKTFDGTDVFIPNSIILKNPLYNYTSGGCMRNSFKLQISIESEFSKASDIILSTLKKIKDISDEKASSLTIEEFTANAIKIEVFYWIDMTSFSGEILYFKGHVQDMVKDALIASGIKMPS